MFIIGLSLISYFIPHYFLKANLLDILSINYKLDFLSNLDYKNWWHFVFIKDFCGNIVKYLPAIGLFSFLCIPYIFLYGEKSKYATLIDCTFGAGILAGVICYVFFKSYIYRDLEDCKNSISCYAISAIILFIYAIRNYQRMSRRHNSTGSYMLMESLTIPFIFSMLVLILALVFGTIAYIFYNFPVQTFVIIILLICGGISSSYPVYKIVKLPYYWIYYFYD